MRMTQANMRTSQDELTAILGMVPDARSTSEALRVLLAEGMRQMLPFVAGVDLAPRWIESQFDLEEIADVALAVLDAKAVIEGKAGPLGGVCRFERLPADSPLAHGAKGEVFVALRPTQQLIDGLIWTVTPPATRGDV